MPTTFIADFPPSLGQEVAGGQHFMIIDSYESKNSVAAGGVGDKLSSIGLYIPSGSLNTGYDGNYEGKEGGSLRSQLGSDVLSSFSSGAGGVPGSAGQGGLDVTKLTAALAQGVIGQATKMAAAKADTGGFISASGNSPNNYMALVYGGPNTFREHTFAFKFFPKNLTESNTVRSIIEEFKRGTLPRMSNITGGSVTGSTLTDPFFKSPRQHTIKFMKGGSKSSGGSNPYLFEIGKSVITDMKINYDPQDMIGFHSDGSPVQIDLSLTFKEIAFQISQDNVSGQANIDLSAAISQNQSSAQSSSTQTAAEFTESRTNTAGFLTDGRGF